jgi:class 3 adenylate cyclase
VDAPTVRYATSPDGLDIAYSTYGDGAVDLVVIPAFVSNLDLWWDRPEHARFADRLAAFARVILFDKRGTGLSSRVTGSPDLETRTRDLRAVLDDRGVERAVLQAHVLDGTALAAMFAATYPHRTHSLILWSPAARGRWAHDYPWGETPEAFQERVAFFERDWGRDAMVAGWQLGTNVPSWSGDHEVARWMVRYFRNAATPGDAVSMARLLFDLDIRALLRSVAAPTLVLYRTGWSAADVEEIRAVANLMPGAKLVGVEGNDRPMWVGNQEPAVAEIQEFLTGVRPSMQPDRVLATVMFTDIVDSTKHITELGDAGWRQLLVSHDAAVRAEVERAGGRWIKSTGDGVLATFDGPARGVRCALAIGDALRPLGLLVRAGVHTGEIELLDGDIGGVAVVIAARITDTAEAGEVRASSTVRDLTAGSGLQFDDAGRHALKGVPQRWHLYRAADP